jgi:hypothetical protein
MCHVSVGGGQVRGKAQLLLTARCRMQMGYWVYMLRQLFAVYRAGPIAN